MTRAPLLVANLGAEEGPRSEPLDPRAEALAAQWRELFEPPAYPWLAEVEAAAWWNDEDAAGQAREAGLRLLGAEPGVVREVHDKAFALRIAASERSEPTFLRGLPTALDPDTLRAADASARIEAVLEGWPEWARARFTLKPRIGTSGRGRVAGSQGRVDAAMRGAFERLAAAGGAVLEPWLDRLADASAQLHIAGDGLVTLLGTLEIVASPAGVPFGHRGEFDSRGRARSGLPEEEALREAAGLAGVAAAAAGYRGPAGIDAFAFRSPVDGGRAFRPLVEFNARFTAGTVAVGYLRRSLPQIKRELGLAPGVLHYFYIAQDAPPAGWPAPAPDALFVPLPGGSQARANVVRPGLFVTPDRARIDALLSGAD